MRGAASVVIVLVLLAASPAPAAQPVEGQTIVAVSVLGLRHIHESVVRQQIESRPGRAYSQSVANDDVARLERLGVFSVIAITPTVVSGGVRVDVRVVETLRFLPTASLAITDESGVSFGPALQVLSVAGRPHDMTFVARFGGDDTVEFSEASPFITGGRVWHSGFVSWRDRYNDLNAFNERSLDLDARIGIRMHERWTTGGIVQLYDVRADRDGITLSAADHDTFRGLGAVVAYDGRDSWKAPTRGWWNSADAIWYTGTGSYGAVDIDVRRYQPITSRGTVVATALLTVRTGQRGIDVPGYADYAIGGENTVRGWGFGSRRGQNQLLASAEYRQMIVKPRPLRVLGLDLYGGLALAAFADMGSAWTGDFAGNTIAGGGVGLRIYLPFIDMIRLDFAIGAGAHGQLGVGEKAEAQRGRIR